LLVLLQIISQGGWDEIVFKKTTVLLGKINVFLPNL